MASIITLTTDFGVTDAYAGIMKGVILGIAPAATIVDISHDVPPQDIVAAHFLLAGAYRYFPPGTIHVAVVDPGVGTTRRPIAIAAGRWLFVGPDNGLFSFLLPSDISRAVHLSNRTYWLPQTSATFHGRDIFAPVAAHLARGLPLDDLGPQLPLSSLVTLPLPQPQRLPGALLAVVVYVDHFGNLITNITNIPPAALGPGGLVLEIAGRRIDSLSTTYGDAPPGRLLALIGSAGYLEIAVNGASAARELAVGVGAHLRILDGISAP